MNYLTTLLHQTHRCSKFQCNRRSLDFYLQKGAMSEAKRSLEACFVWAPEADRHVHGYYTLTNCRIGRERIPKKLDQKLPRSFTSIPVTLISRLAVHRDIQGQGWGSMLVVDALKRSFETSKTIGSFAVVVDPNDANGRAFYEYFGFIGLPGTRKLFLVMKTINQLFDPATLKD